jgi:hypothetical protein
MMTGCTVVVYQPSLCQVPTLTSQGRGHSPGSTSYRDVESHREQSGRKSRSPAIVSESCLEGSCCLLVQVTVVTLATPI